MGLRISNTIAQHNTASILSKFYFILIALIIISQISSFAGSLNFLCKPLLIPILAVFYVSSNPVRNKSFYGILSALFFSWLGDVFLLFEQHYELFFIAGLSAFLIAHLCYIFVFNLDVKTFQLLKTKPFLPLLLMLYLFGFLYLLYPDLNELLLPVCIYASIICTMLLFAILRYGQVNLQSFKFCCLGALLFVLSDSVIAINKFLLSFKLAYPIIITLYAIGQFYIIKGSLLNKH